MCQEEKLDEVSCHMRRIHVSYEEEDTCVR